MAFSKVTASVLVAPALLLSRADSEEKLCSQQLMCVLSLSEVWMKILR